MARVLITNGGPHPAEAWAVATAEELFPIDNDIEAVRRVQALQLQAAVAVALITHHKSVAEKEQSALAADANARFASEHDVDKDAISSAMQAVEAAAEGTPWQDHVAKPEVKEAHRRIIENHFITNQHVHRLWHADHNPDNASGKAYKARFHGAAQAEG